jgi:hypothetical protein
MKLTKKVSRENGKSTGINLENGYLICNYSSVRYRKDKYEMEKQIASAKQVIENPTKRKKAKFTTSIG